MKLPEYVLSRPVEIPLGIPSADRVFHMSVQKPVENPTPLNSIWLDPNRFDLFAPPLCTG
jgi:hypothetical protein